MMRDRILVMLTFAAVVLPLVLGSGRTVPCKEPEPVVLRTPQDTVLHDVIAYGKRMQLYRGNKPLPNSIVVDGSLWIVPKTRTVTRREIDDNVGDWFGGPYTLWEYASSAMDYVCYYNPITELPFPVTSNGIELDIDLLWKADICAEDIYMVSDTTLTCYTADNLGKVGWRERGEGAFSFSIPPNGTGRERLWRVQLFLKDEDIYRRDTVSTIERVIMESWKGKKHAFACLDFVQVVDSGFLPQFFTRDGYWKVQRQFPEDWKCLK